MIISGTLVDIENRHLYKGEIHIREGKIIQIIPKDNVDEHYILPGFIDAHIHIESSMLVPSEFARIAVMHGTVSTVSDPHEIGNVLGAAGVRFMIENGKTVPFKFNFGAPSCVPATSFESAGAVIDASEIGELMALPEIKYLAEVMNYPGVIYGDEEVIKKIEWAKSFNKPIDGHAPGLRGEDLKTYVSAGISTDHECFTADEALEKLSLGMKILIREGSAAKNFDALIDLAHHHSDHMMFCSDDKHPDDLIVGHINTLVKRAIGRGIDRFNVLKMACINPVKHYNLAVGMLREGDDADFIVVNNLADFDILKTVVRGIVVAENGESKINPTSFHKPNKFDCAPKNAFEFEIDAQGNQIRVIEALDGQLITHPIVMTAKIEDGKIQPDLAHDILKIVVVNRYKNVRPAVAFVKNFGLKEGAIASSVAHDSHNIIAVGVNDEMLAKAVNSLIAEKGGICAVNEFGCELLPLPVAGIMSDKDGWITGKKFEEIDKKAKEMGSTLHAPFMTLSFMALLVIPSLKLSDFGLFDGSKFEFTAVSFS